MVPEPFSPVPKPGFEGGPTAPRNAASTPSARWRHVEKFAALVIASPVIIVCSVLLALIRIKEFLR